MREETIQLQSILLPDTAVGGVEELYYHRNGKRTDYNGYFNLFYIEKRKRYTDIYNLILKIQLKGYNSLILVHDGKDIGKVELKDEELREYQIPFPYGIYGSGCFWFALTESTKNGIGRDGDIHIGIGEIRQPECGEHEPKDCFVSGFYVTEIVPDRIRDVSIGAVICTYRREAYVARNLRQLKERVLERLELDVASRVKLYIIDNGKTLDRCDEIQKLVADCAGKTVILPNKNAGGAGGFTRGMIEVLKAKEQEGFTHVLLMDDDAVFEPDAFVRIHGLAATLKEKWKDITIGGAMLREDFPYILYCAGEHWESGLFAKDERNLDLRSYRQASGTYLTGAGHEKELYSGWWLCCYSLNMVGPDKLPLPIFIHGDDVELGHRYRSAGIVFLNGISVWHREIETSFVGSNVYYIRNKLITLSICQERNGKRIAARTVVKSILSMLLRYRYDEAQNIYRGVSDFIRGPVWLYHQNPEDLNNQVRKIISSSMPVESLKNQISETEYKLVLDQIKRYRDNYSIEVVNRYWNNKKKPLAFQFLTMLREFLQTNKHMKVIFPTDIPYEGLTGKKKVYYDLNSNSVQLYEINFKKILLCLWLCLKAEGKILLYFHVTADAYRRYLPKITSQKAWEKYLEIND